MLQKIILIIFLIFILIGLVVIDTWIADGLGIKMIYPSFWAALVYQICNGIVTILFGFVIASAFVNIYIQN